MPKTAISTSTSGTLVPTSEILAANAGRLAVACLDLASTKGLATLLILFPGEPTLVAPYFWLPEENVDDFTRKDLINYTEGVDAGEVIATPGNVIDYKTIKAQVVEVAKNFDLATIACNPRNAKGTISELREEEGLPIFELSFEGYNSISDPTKQVLAAISAGKIEHGGNGVLRASALKLVTRKHGEDERPDAELSLGPITGIRSLIGAWAAQLAPTESDPISITEIEV